MLLVVREQNLQKILQFLFFLIFLIGMLKLINFFAVFGQFFSVIVYQRVIEVNFISVINGVDKV